ncbi:MMPL family transporter [Kineosporia babensis]|uniref:MMPL family transporter n=1 Tax=Kineosporia babensis TaxID=499548 RepID=A0A9X1N8D4_9ACTN|nr:MMPL family transporter [Kineosporia babensis]MCD5310267.1 MMPL family transporter [Kineosporia babensis]
MNQKTSLASRFTRLLHAAPRRSLLAVLLFVVLAGVVGGPVAGALDTEGGFTPPDAESTRAVERVEEVTGLNPASGVVLLVDTARTSTQEVAGTLAGIEGMTEVTQDSTLVTGMLRADAAETEVAHDVVEAFADNDAVTAGGQAVMQLQLGEQTEQDLTRAELLAFPALVLLSILIFGGRGAVLPLVIGVTTVIGTFLVLMGANQIYGLSIFALNLVIGLGLGLAVDYALFLLNRYREELATQGAGAAAVITTMQTAGRTVVYSAATVAVALATLAVFPMGFLRSMGIAGAAVAVVAALASLIIAPALFGLWGAKLARRQKDNQRWYHFSHAVMRRPGVIATATAAVMLLLAAPALRANWTPVDASIIPTDLSSRVVADALEDENDTAVIVAIESDNAAQVQTFATEAGALNGVAESAGATDLGQNVWQLNLMVAGDAAGPDAQRVVEEVRDLATDQGVDALVTGEAASFIDQQQAISGTLPIAVTALVLLTMLVLWLMTGSVVLPVKAVIMNVLTVGVSLGAITFIYQDGRLENLLGYTPNGGVEPTNFLVAAAMVFALSTDYGVFLLGRIKEARESGLPEREAVAIGLGRTGSIVTAAAILLAVAIGAFSTSEISFMQQIGIATAVGVLVDAFVVRSLLVPTLMAMMGKWNWWSPMWLRKVHDKVGLSEGRPELAVPAPADAAR